MIFPLHMFTWECLKEWTSKIFHKVPTNSTAQEISNRLQVSKVADFMTPLLLVVWADLLEDCAQLVKANSIEGNKKATGGVRIVYTMWSNLHKTRSMETGQIGFHRMKEVSKENQLKRGHSCSSWNYVCWHLSFDYVFLCVVVQCYYTNVEKRDNTIVNRLNKTKVEKDSSIIQKTREEYDLGQRKKEKEEKKSAVTRLGLLLGSLHVV